MIETLITTPDTAERVRDRIAEILAAESAAQVVLAGQRVRSHQRDLDGLHVDELLGRVGGRPERLVALAALFRVRANLRAHWNL